MAKKKPVGNIKVKGLAEELKKISKEMKLKKSATLSNLLELMGSLVKNTQEELKAAKKLKGDTKEYTGTAKEKRKAQLEDDESLSRDALGLAIKRSVKARLEEIAAIKMREKFQEQVNEGIEDVTHEKRSAAALAQQNEDEDYVDETIQLQQKEQASDEDYADESVDLATTFADLDTATEIAIFQQRKRLKEEERDAKLEKAVRKRMIKSIAEMTDDFVKEYHDNIEELNFASGEAEKAIEAKQAALQQIREGERHDIDEQTAAVMGTGPMAKMFSKVLFASTKKQNEEDAKRAEELKESLRENLEPLKDGFMDFSNELSSAMLGPFAGIAKSLTNIGSGIVKRYAKDKATNFKKWAKDKLDTKKTFKLMKQQVAQGKEATKTMKAQMFLGQATQMLMGAMNAAMAALGPALLVGLAGAAGAAIGLAISKGIISWRDKGDPDKAKHERESAQEVLTSGPQDNMATAKDKTTAENLNKIMEVTNKLTKARVAERYKRETGKDAYSKGLFGADKISSDADAAKVRQIEQEERLKLNQETYSGIERGSDPQMLKALENLTRALAEKPQGGVVNSSTTVVNNGGNESHEPMHELLT